MSNQFERNPRGTVDLDVYLKKKREGVTSNPDNETQKVNEIKSITFQCRGRNVLTQLE